MTFRDNKLQDCILHFSVPIAKTSYKESAAVVCECFLEKKETMREDRGKVKEGKKEIERREETEKKEGK